MPKAQSHLLGMCLLIGLGFIGCPKHVPSGYSDSGVESSTALAPTPTPSPSPTPAPQLAQVPSTHQGCIVGVDLQPQGGTVKLLDCPVSYQEPWDSSKLSGDYLLGDLADHAQWAADKVALEVVQMGESWQGLPARVQVGPSVTMGLLLRTVYSLGQVGVAHMELQRPDAQIAVDLPSFPMDPMFAGCMGQQLGLSPTAAAWLVNGDPVKVDRGNQGLDLSGVSLPAPEGPCTALMVMTEDGASVDDLFRLGTALMGQGWERIYLTFAQPKEADPMSPD